MKTIEIYLSARISADAHEWNNLKAMQESDIGLLLPLYGRDCAWEVGWYANSEKLLVVYTENNTERLRDWMVKGGIDQVITPTDWLFDVLKNDPILAEKSRLIESRSKLSDVLVEIYKQSRGDISG